MNPITLWLDRAQSEFKTPNEMRKAAQFCKDKNTKKLLENRASQWGGKIISKRHDKHWKKNETEKEKEAWEESQKA